MESPYTNLVVMCHKMFDFEKDFGSEPRIKFIEVIFIFKITDKWPVVVKNERNVTTLSL